MSLLKYAQYTDWQSLFHNRFHAGYFNAERVILSREDKIRSTCTIAFLPSPNSANKKNILLQIKYLHVVKQKIKNEK